jgi:23S rRNA (uracil1939-C5)-methyltransferase
MKKKQPLILEKIEITGVAEKGRGVGRHPDGRVLFVEHAVPGDVVDVKIVKKRLEYLEGYAILYHHLSKDRTETFCKHFHLCGGCLWQHVNYAAQISYKEQFVKDALQRIAKVAPEEFLQTIPAIKSTFYRNKLEFAFSNKKWLTTEEMESGISNLENVLGFHRAGAFDKIVDIKECWLQEAPSNELRNIVKEIALARGFSFYDLREQTGMMRHIMIRLTTQRELMLIVSFQKNQKAKIKGFLDDVIMRVPQLTSVFYCINPKENDYVLDLEMICYYGKNYIEEQLGHIRFKIGPKSFFQTNSYQALVLYNKVVELAGFRGEETVYDLYTGVGSIALFIAKYCKKVVGIEEVPEAIQDAIENAQINSISNCSFYAGDVKNILTEDFAATHGKPDVLITDPPRAGMQREVVQILLKLEASSIVYVSCNPATQARDLNLLSDKYNLLKIQPVDMFPHTYHIETIALLKIKSSEKMPAEY